MPGTKSKRWRTPIEGLLFWGSGTAGIYFFGIGWGLLIMVMVALLIGVGLLLISPVKSKPPRGPLGSGVSAFPVEQTLREPQTIGMHEYGMGGPISDDLVLPDGAVIESVFGCSASYRAGRFFVGLSGSPHGNAFVTYDAQKHLLYRVDSDSATALVTRLQRTEGRHCDYQLGAEATGPDVELARLAEKAGPFQPFARLMLDVKPVQLCRFHGLWLTPDDCPAEIPTHLQLPLREGQRLELRLRASMQKKHAANPAHFASKSPYEIVLDGQPTGRYAHGLERACVSPDESSIALAGAIFNADYLVIEQVWHIYHRQQWIVVDALVDAAPSLPGRLWHQPTRYELAAVRQIEGNHIHFKLASLAVTGVRPRKTFAASVALRSSLSESPQRLPVVQGMLKLQLGQTVA